MKKTKRMIRNLILFILLIILTFYIILKDQDITEILNIVQNVKIQFIIIAIILLFVASFFFFDKQEELSKKYGEECLDFLKITKHIKPSNYHDFYLKQKCKDYNLSDKVINAIFTNDTKKI